MNKSTKHFAKLSKKILKHFDFKKVEKAMYSLDWKWGSSDSTPTLEELKETAIYLMKKAYYVHGTISTGGFTATYRKGELQLYFCVSEWTEK